MVFVLQFLAVFRICTFLGLLDPDPYCSYLYGSGSGSGFVSGSFHQQAKILRNLDFNCYVTFNYLLSLNTGVNEPTVTKKQKNLFFVIILRATDEISRIRIIKMSRIRNYGFLLLSLLSLATKLLNSGNRTLFNLSAGLFGRN
jgi:hypothetical protein